MSDLNLITMQEVQQEIMQNMQILKKTQDVKTSVSSVECYVCGKGLQEGYSISAKTLPSGIALFCNIHYPLQ